MTPRQQIAHCRITVKLGEGGMGEVWRDTDTKPCPKKEKAPPFAGAPGKASTGKNFV